MYNYDNTHYQRKVWDNIKWGAGVAVLLWLLSLLSSCSRRSHQLPVTSNHINQYGYKLTSPALLYVDSSTRSDIFATLKAGDTITTERPIVLRKWNVVESAGKAGYINSPSLYALYDPKYSFKANVAGKEQARDLNSVDDLTNGFGLGLGFSSNKALLIDVLYKRSRIMYQAGLAYQLNGQRGKSVNERLSNYGTTSLGSNNYFLVLTVGVNYWIAKRIAIGVDGAIGSRDYFTNYSDKRFSGDAYHLIYASELAAGIGGKIHFLPKKHLLVSAGYNTLVGGSLSLSFVPYGSDF